MSQDTAGGGRLPRDEQSLKEDLVTRTANALVGLVLVSLVSVSCVCQATGAERPAGQMPGGPHDRTYSVLWDLSHGQYSGYAPSGSYSDLADMLTEHEINCYETTTSLEFVSLDAYDMIVIGTVLAWDSAYTGPELAAVEEFVSTGGGLLIMGDNASCPNENITPVSEAFGVSSAAEGEFNGAITDFDALELFTDVDTLQIVWGTGLEVASPSETIARGPGGESAVSLMGDCEVIMICDCNLWENQYIGLADNETFALNVFSCLCGADTPVVRSTWGTIKSLYR
jgi:hypothetical protein